MTSIPASRSARAMILAPRSWPSRPGLATTTRILRFSAMGVVHVTRGCRLTIRHARHRLEGPMGGLLGCSLVALLLAGSGLGPPGMETTIQDDATLLHRSDAEVRQAARQIAELGADRVRITAGWSVLAPSPRKRRRPGAPFDPRDSRTYPEAGFEALDRAVRAVHSAGMD